MTRLSCGFWCSREMFVTKFGRTEAVTRSLKAQLVAAGKDVYDFGGILSNPTYAKVQEGARLSKEHKIDFILAVGGGSVIDCCKIVSVQAKTEKDIWTLEYDEEGKPGVGIPFGAIVTASGTGAEMNNGAVITNEERKQKSPLWGSFAILPSSMSNRC